MFWKKKGKKVEKKQESSIITKESLCATCAMFSFLALLVLCSKAWIFGSVGASIHSFLTGALGYFAYPIFFGITYLSITCLLGKRLVKNRRLGWCIACTLIFVGMVMQTAMTYSWPLEGYVEKCFLSGETFPDTAVCGAAGAFIIDKAAALISRLGVIVLFSVMAAFFACLCCILAKKSERTSVGKNKKKKELVEQEEQPVQEADSSTQQLAPTVTQEETPVQSEDTYSTPNVQQRPAVVLGGETTATAPEMNVQAQETEAVYSRDFLFGGTPAENYQRNLIFDPNARVNRRPIDGKGPERESVYVPSYSDSYETSVNMQDTPSTMVTEDAAPSYTETQKPVSTPSYTTEEAYLNDSYEESTMNRYGTSNEEIEGREVVEDKREYPVEEDSNGRDEGSMDIQEEDKPYERHRYMDLFSPSNPRVFGEAEETSRLEDSYEEEDSRNGYVERGRDSFSEERDERDGSRLLDDEDDPYTLRTDYEEEPRYDREVAETRGRGAEISENVEDRGGETRGREVEVTPPPVEKPIEQPKPRVIKPYRRVPLDDFDCRDIEPTANQEEVEFTKANILATLEEFRITGVTIASVTFGPTVTRYNLILPRNIPPRKIIALDESIAISLYSSGVNIYTNYEEGGVTIEVPNKERQFVQLGCMLSGDTFVNAKPSSLMFAMGKDVANRKVYGDISKMIHLLVAGSSGSGKSVFLGSLIISLIYKYSPEELRLILIDPKKTEFVLYNNLPHLMINEIITDAGKAVQSLNWAIGEMNRRYGLFEQMSRAGTYVVNLDQYNEQLEKSQRLPKIVIIIDELADLMLAAKKDMEDRIQNLTQKARAAGIHLIVATQRPSIDVITGVIKSNLATRVAFYVATDVDSRVILDQSGAQKLLGKGDFLYTMPGVNIPVRVQSAFISPEDAQKVVNYIKNNNEAYYDEEATAYINSRGGNGGSPCDPFDTDGNGDSVDPVFIDALRYVILSNSASISMIQRKCSIGYNRAGKVIEWMEDMGYISPFDGAKARKVLITKEEFESKYGPL